MGTARTRRAICGLGLLGLLSGFRSPDEQEALGPDHPDDPRWAAFRGVKVAVDGKKGLASAIFPPDLLKADNQPMEIGGYMIPLEASTLSRHFLLTRRSSGCPFCPPNEANEAVEVFTNKPVRYQQQQVFVRGRLKLVPSSQDGLFFQIREASAS